MRRLLSMAIFTFWVVLIAGICFGTDNPTATPTPIRVTDESDHLRLINSYQAAISAQTQFENSVLRAKLKYKVPLDYSYNFDTMNFDPPRQATQTVQVPAVQPPAKSAPPDPKPK